MTTTTTTMTNALTAPPGHRRGFPQPRIIARFAERRQMLSKLVSENPGATLRQLQRLLVMAGYKWSLGTVHREISEMRHANTSGRV